MNNEVIVQLVSIVCLAILGFFAMYKGSDGNIIASVITAIGVIAGAVVVKEVQKRNEV